MDRLIGAVESRRLARDLVARIFGEEPWERLPAVWPVRSPQSNNCCRVVRVLVVGLSAAILLIVEMNGPFTGLMQVSSVPMRDALSQISK